MKFFVEFINQYGISIIHSVVAVILSYVSLEIKKIYKRYYTDRIKRDVVRMVCQAVNQLYPKLSGEDKLNKTIINCREILDEKGIVINDLELRMYIESSVGLLGSDRL